MDTAPLVAALTSTVALALAATLARLVWQDRRRSQARIAMLSSLAAEPLAFAPDLPAAAPVVAPPVRLAPKRDIRRAAAEPALVRPRAATLSAAEIEIFRDPRADAAPATGAMFEPASSGTGRALVYVFVAAVVMAALIAFSFRWALSSPGVTTETTASIATAPAPSIAPLSLVALSHEQHADGTLLIRGVVRNPPGAASRERLFAMATLVDGAGAEIATARAPLDFTTLAGGDESPFVVRIAGADGVARYRVGFRDAAGQAVGHVDGR